MQDLAAYFIVTSEKVDIFLGYKIRFIKINIHYLYTMFI